MEEDAGAREIDEDAGEASAAKRPRMFPPSEALVPSPSASPYGAGKHTAAPVASSVLNTRAILSVLKGRWTSILEIVVGRALCLEAYLYTQA